jgi:hypothetical protein
VKGHWHWHWHEHELRTQWSLSIYELAFLSKRMGSGRLGCAILLKFFLYQRFFPESLGQMPNDIVTHLTELTHFIQSSIVFTEKIYM